MGGAQRIISSRLSWWIYLTILLFLPIELSGQQVEILFFHQLTSAQGLTAQSNNHFIFKDSPGFVWISSTHGLNRFDGQEVKQYLADRNNKHALLDGNIQGGFFEEPNTDFWFCTNDGIHKYDRKQDLFHRFHIQSSRGDTLSKDYRLLQLDTTRRTLWIRVGDTLYLKNVDQSFPDKNIGVFRRISHYAQLKYAPDIDQFRLFMPHKNGMEICRFTPNGEQIGCKNHLKGIPTKSIYCENDTLWWVGTDKGLLRFNPKLANQANQLLYRLNPKIKGIINIIPLDNNTLIIATKEQGIFFFDKKNEVRQIYKNDGNTILPFSFKINQVFLDPQQVLWILTEGQGIFYTHLKKRKFKTISPFPSYKSDKWVNVKAMTEDTKGRIWCLSHNGAFVLDHEGKLLPESNFLWGEKVPFSKHFPMNIISDSFENIWVTTHLGFYGLNKKEGFFKKIETSTTHPGKNGFTFSYQKKDGRILVASSKSGLFELKNIQTKRDKELVDYSALPASGPFTQIFEDSNQRLYLSQNYKQLSVYDKNHVLINSFSLNDAVNGIIEDQDSNRIWVASYTGLYKLAFKNEKIALEKDTILPFQTLNAILQDTLGVLWMSTNDKIISYNPDSAIFKSYHLSDGLQAIQFNQWSALALSDGRLAFGGINGINIFNPYEIQAVQALPNPVITYIEINNQPSPAYVIDQKTKATSITEIHKIVLQHFQNDIVIKTTPLEYSAPSDNKYLFQLFKSNKLISEKIGKSNVFEYPNMPPGSYTLKFNASNSDGLFFSESIKEIIIIISSPWWARWWAISIWATIGVALFLLYYRYRINSIRKEAKYLQLIAESETAVLRLQMNPHFIFNSMNSISSYIAQKNIDTANDYLNRFAKLMRMILNYSAQSFILVSEEIELLRLYMKTESMRFEKQFQFDFILDENFDPDEYQIPTMILQPFVENAIWHGLSNKNGIGEIIIRFWIEDGSMKCSVKDNGVGRINTVKSTNKKPHESKAFKIISQRMHLLGIKNHIKPKVEIIDLFDDNKHPLGTKVLLQFPIM